MARSSGSSRSRPVSSRARRRRWSSVFGWMCSASAVWRRSRCELEVGRDGPPQVAARVPVGGAERFEDAPAQVGRDARCAREQQLQREVVQRHDAGAPGGAGDVHAEPHVGEARGDLRRARPRRRPPRPRRRAARRRAGGAAARDRRRGRPRSARAPRPRAGPPRRARAPVRPRPAMAAANAASGPPTADPAARRSRGGRASSGSPLTQRVEQRAQPALLLGDVVLALLQVRRRHDARRLVEVVHHHLGGLRQRVALVRPWPRRRARARPRCRRSGTRAAGPRAACPRPRGSWPTRGTSSKRAGAGASAAGDPVQAQVEVLADDLPGSGPRITESGNRA